VVWIIIISVVFGTIVGIISKLYLFIQQILLSTYQMPKTLSNTEILKTNSQEPVFKSSQSGRSNCRLVQWCSEVVSPEMLPKCWTFQVNYTYCLFVLFLVIPTVFYSCSAYQSIILIKKGVQVQPGQYKMRSLLRRMFILLWRTPKLN